MKTEILTCERIEKGERPWTLSAARILPDRRPREIPVLKGLQLIPGRKKRS